MSDFKIIESAGRITNLIMNPSFEIAVAGTGWAAYNTGAPGRSTDRSVYGAACLGVVSVAPNDGAQYDITLDASTTYYVSYWIYDSSIDNITTEIYDVTGAASVATETYTPTQGVWARRAPFAFTTNAGSTSYRLIIRSSDAGAFFIDGVMLAATAGTLTYVDGEQPGCTWLGTPHASRSELGAASRAGGIISDLYDDLGFQVSTHIDTGVNAQGVNVDRYAGLPGGALNGIDFPERILSLVGTIWGTGTDCDIHETRRDLTDALASETFPRDENGYQPFILRYTGATTEKQIACYYESGLEANLGPNQRIHEPATIRLVSPDPYWRSVTDEAGELDEQDGPTLHYITARFKDTGQWDTMNLGSNPTTGGTVYAILRANSGLVYVGGDFTGHNGQAGRDYIAVYNPITDAWADVGSHSALDAPVWDLAEDAAGNIYIVGEFSKTGGGTQDYITRWDGTNYNAVGTPGSGAANITAIYAVQVEIGAQAAVVIGGSFSTFGNVSGADNVAYYTSGSAWQAFGSGLAGAVAALTEDLEGQTWAGGIFTTDGKANTMRRVGYFDGADWVEPGGGFNAAGRALLSTDAGVYAGGEFTQTGDGSITGLNLIALWTGAVWEPLDAGLTGGGGSVNALDIGPDGLLWAGGEFTTGGPFTSLANLARWTGDAWLQTDIQIASSNVRAIEVGLADAQLERLYDTYVGYNTTGSKAIAGTTTVTHSGTARAYPRVVIRRGVAAAASTLRAMRNETTGREVVFEDYKLLAGETVTLYFDLGNVRAVSSIRGNISYIFAPGVSQSEFFLVPGDNQITFFAGAGIDVYLIWNATFRGYDD